MCLAVPAEVVEMLDNDLGTIEVGGAKSRVSLSLVDGVSVGDFVLVHAGFAIEIIDETEARKTMELFEQLEQLAGPDEVP
jgi:hydrogenase expression/formation protein HypC